MKIAHLLLCLLASSSLIAADDEESAASTGSELSTNELAAGELAASGDLGPTADGFQNVGDFGPGDDEAVDPKVLRDFIENRGLIQCRQKVGTLTIAGDVRARWICTGEEVNGKKARGGPIWGNKSTTAINLFKSEVNLFFDYVAPKSWVSTKLKWVTFDGIDGGTSTKVELDRAFIGYDIYECDERDFYIEVGRSRLDYIFDSRVEFGSVFDGIHIYYTDYWPSIGTFVAHGGPFLIDTYTNHYGWIIETGVTELGGTDFSFKYSIIDWHRHAPTLNYGNISKDQAAEEKLYQSGTLSFIDNPRYRFIVSQMLFAYQRKIDWPGCKTFFAYGAVLVNHDAKRTPESHNKKANGAWYVGFTLGKLCKACDWSFDLNYQYVGAQAVPEFDLSGIGHGNAANTLLSDAIINELGPTVFGFCNFKGWQATLLYALTDTLTIRLKAEASVPVNQSIGGDFRYKNFEMAAIYAF